jgi:outer membrane receptor protein involved in Fe transport
MTRPRLPKTPLALAVAALALPAAPAWSQDAPAAPAAASAPARGADDAPHAKGPTLDLTEVVVTGTSSATSKMKSSVSVSTLDGDRLIDNQPQNAADVLTAIPGLFVQSSGGGGNANVSVRGLPVSAGGSRYLQFQEDGLPVLLFGDIAFGNPDDFIRVDQTIDRVEAVRGGSASTLTTNGPGGIVNYITKTGDVPGGVLAVTSGLGFQDERIDFAYGGALSPKTHYFVGGFHESGKGPRRTAGGNAVEGGQIKGNLTQKVDAGYVRLNFKLLDDHQPMFMPGPVEVVDGRIHTIPGIDPRKYTGYSAAIPVDTVLNDDNTSTIVHMNDGMRTRSAAIGLETHLDLSQGWVLDDKFRRAANSGRWAAWYPGGAAATAAAGTTYATGTLAGQPYSGLSMTSVAFDVDVKDLGNTTNDLKLTKTFEPLGGGRLTAGAGLFLNDQAVDLVWNFNGYLTSVSEAPVLLNNASQGATQGGSLGPGFGGCCSRDYDGQYHTVAPYAFATFDLGGLTVDGSVREDDQRASGYYNIAQPTSTAAGAPLAYSAADVKPIDYALKRTEYSLGANYALNRQVAVFARYSDGASFNADRIMDLGPLDGSASIPVNTVRQLEGGVKANLGHVSAFVTLFDAKVSESNYSATTQAAAANTYDAMGVELESSYNSGGGWYVNVGATYTDSKTRRSTNPALVGLPANRQPKLIYQVGPGFETERLDVGVQLVGVGSSKDSDTATSAGVPYVKLPAYTLVNGHATYNFDDHASFTLGFYNLFNRIGWTEVDSADAARAVNGRTLRGTLRYAF